MPSQEVTLRPLGAPGDLGWVVMAHGEVYAAEFGWDTRFEALVAQIVVDYTASDRPQSQGAWIVLGSRLVATAVGFARAAGYERMRLWANHPLVAARRIYLEQGFCLVAEEPHHSFGVDLIGQTYELALTETD